jgi:hypothetical protein
LSFAVALGCALPETPDGLEEERKEADHAPQLDLNR